MSVMQKLILLYHVDSNRQGNEVITAHKAKLSR